MDKQMLKEEIAKGLLEKYGCRPKNALPWQLHDVLGGAVMKEISENWKKSVSAHEKGRRACYFSAEFLVGRAVYNNLLCLGLTETAEEALKELGASLSSLEEIEDAALGNGGLGRLAACFLDSAATMELPLDGYGIRYKYGLFRQAIADGKQEEYADDWTKHGDPWSKRCESDSVYVAYGDETVKAVPYDMPIIGAKTNHIGNLRLWQAEPVEEFDFSLFNDGKYAQSVAAKVSAENISRVLYPNDNCEEGRILRLKQEYFFSSASLQDIVRKHKLTHGSALSFGEYNAVQLNDTHPVISVPELIRILVDEEKLTFDKAFEIAQKTFSYTNHTIMQEALEKWDERLVEKVLPRVFEIIIMLNERLIRDLYGKGLDKEKIDGLKIIGGGQVRMANMAVYCSSFTNGVAEIHTEILKNDVLSGWYGIYPRRFQNKTNGITQRRWLWLCNRELSALITELLGSDGWVTDLSKLKSLEKFADDEGVLRRFIEIKKEKKRQLAAHIAENEGVIIDPDSVFDIQIKRLHEYKRQLLNAFSILWIYFGIKDGSIKDFKPTTFIFGAKAAPGYRRAKGIIRFINEISELVNSDPETKGLINVVFVQNYNVSYAEKLVAAADISEQISTAGTEASGTGNMKFMLNGTVTLGTLDGANVEIVQEAGEENNYIFGAKVEELEKLMPEYDPRKLLSENEKIRRVVSTLIDGTVSDGGLKSDDGTSVFRELYFSLTDGASWHVPDRYYLLGDLESYAEAKLRAISDTGDELAFARKCWLNMCSAGRFSSDRTISDYAENIWKISPISID